MSKITGLKKSQGRGKQVNVYLDGKLACRLLAEVIRKEGLRVGQELTESHLEALTGLDRLQRCFNAASRYLSYRPRSEAEIKQRLQRHGFDDSCTGKTLARLKEQGLVDDAAFAHFWIENRETFRPRSRRMTMLELRRKGLNNDVIEEIVSEVDDRESAYKAALSKARRLFASDYLAYRRKMSQYLGRRGFSYEVINEVVPNVWKEYINKPEESYTVKR